MKKSITAVVCAVLLAFGLAVSEGVSWTGQEWNGSTEGEYPNRNCDIVSIAREPARVDSVPYTQLDSAIQGAVDYAKELSTMYMLLSQTDWSFRWYANPSECDSAEGTVFWQKDYDAGNWDTIFVPSVWQTEGYDYPVYTNTVQKFAKQSGNDTNGYPRDLPEAPETYNPVGLYRHSFEVPADWDGYRIYIDFEGVNSAMYLWVNGIQAGYSEDSFTTHEFDITDYIKPGEENTIAVKVYRWCDGSWIEDQDMFDLSGIFRDVYIYAAPQVRVRDFTVSTDFDSTFTDSTLDVTVNIRNYTDKTGSAEVTVHLFDAEGAEVNLVENSLLADIAAFTEEELSISIPVSSPRKWSAEDPYLYTLVLEEVTSQGTVYESYQTGFRKITYKTNASGQFEGSTDDADLIRINGQPIMFRGVDRHETHPEYGYALTREVMEEDIRIMLENNINAVRTSHYPNNPYWYYLCDKYGIYVVDEANVECHSNMTTANERLTEYMSNAIIDREYSMVRRDKNHASVVMWSLGNENKNPDILRTILVSEYEDPEGTPRVLHEYTSTRPWHYEQAREMYETGIDVRSGMYALPDELAAHGEADGSVPMIECEYEHAMGNSEGNFDEYWEVYEEYRNLQGGFIWDYIDQSIYAVNEDGGLYFGYGGDYGDHSNDGNFCANGLLLPDRTVQPEMAEVKYHYQQIKLEDVDIENGVILIKNWFLFTDPAEKYDFCWELTRDDRVLDSGVLDSSLLHIACVDPVTNQAGEAEVTIPYTLNDADLLPGCAYFITVRVKLRKDEGLLKAGHVIAQQQFELQPELPQAVLAELPGIAVEKTDESVTVCGEGFTASFSTATGALAGYTVNGVNLLAPGTELTGNFFRARTDNDTGFNYGLFIFNNYWKDAGDYHLTLFDCEAQTDRAVITAKGCYPNLNGLEFDTVYTVYGDGAVMVSVKIIPNYDKSYAYLPVAGIQLTLPAEYENLTFFGRGPEETYNDRYKGTITGLWKTTVTDNFFPYVKTSETGNHVDVRCVSLTDAEGNGIMVSSVGNGFEMSALHYTAGELDRHVHPYELTESDEIYLRINAAQEGVGGDNAWSRIVTHEQYLLNDEVYEYSFILAPVSADDDLTARSAELRNRAD